MNVKLDGKVSKNEFSEGLASLDLKIESVKMNLGDHDKEFLQLGSTIGQIQVDLEAKLS